MKPKPVLLPLLDKWSERKIIADAIYHREVMAARDKYGKAIEAIEQEQSEEAQIMTYTNQILADCAAREVKWRIRVYANRINSGRMTRAQAANEIAMMEAIRDHFLALAATEQPELQLDG